MYFKFTERYVPVVLRKSKNGYFIIRKSISIAWNVSTYRLLQIRLHFEKKKLRFWSWASTLSTGCITSLQDVGQEVTSQKVINRATAENFKGANVHKKSALEMTKNDSYKINKLL